MRARLAFLVIGGVVVALAGGGCGGDDSTESVPTVDELAASLLAPNDMDGTWSVTVPDADVDLSGVVTDEMREMLPKMELCAGASDEARAAVDGLSWDAFMQLELETDDPIQPPDDRTGHMIFLQEFLTATDSAVTTETFDLLRDGIEACLGEIEAGEEGPGFAEPMEIPELGDDSYGVLTTVEEAGGWAEWRLHQIIVHDGPVLLDLVVTDIRAGDGVEPYFTIDEIGDIAQNAVDKLHGTAAAEQANPASVYCVEQGGRVDIVDEGGGQSGYCELPDGRRIEEWEYYRSGTAITEP